MITNSLKFSVLIDHIQATRVTYWSLSTCPTPNFSISPLPDVVGAYASHHVDLQYPVPWPPALT